MAPLRIRRRRPPRRGASSIPTDGGHQIGSTSGSIHYLTAVMARSDDGNVWDFLSLGDTNHAAGGDFASSSNTGAQGSSQAPMPPPGTDLAPPAPHLGGFPPPTAGGYGQFPHSQAYAGHHLVPHPVTAIDLNASSSSVGGTPAKSPPAPGKTGLLAYISVTNAQSLPFS